MLKWLFGCSHLMYSVNSGNFDITFEGGGVKFIARPQFCVKCNHMDWVQVEAIEKEKIDV
jgi:hypothetical protein